MLSISVKEDIILANYWTLVKDPIGILVDDSAAEAHVDFSWLFTPLKYEITFFKSHGSEFLEIVEIEAIWSILQEVYDMYVTLMQKFGQFNLDRGR